MKKKKVRFASVSHTRWAFYESLEADSDSAADWFETLYIHYQNRGKKIKKLREEIENLKYLKRARLY